MVVVVVVCIYIYTYIAKAESEVQEESIKWIGRPVTMTGGIRTGTSSESQTERVADFGGCK